MTAGFDFRYHPWEAAYVAFETTEQDVRKSMRRLRALGAESWPRDARVLDLFCGSGGGLRALERLGFFDAEGADLSQRLLDRYTGPFRRHCCDCRRLSPFESGSRDVVLIQGGLHHLDDLDRDLPATLAEVRRVLATDGILALVEPWSSPFLTLAHRICGSRLARLCSRKIDALAAMIDAEGRTYRRWLANPDWILTQLERMFVPVRASVRWGKLLWVGRRRPETEERA